MNIRTLQTSLLLLSLPLLLPAATAQVDFSAPGGFYSHPFTLSLNTAPGLEIHYTTDGSLPSPQSPLYTHPLPLSPQLHSPRNLFQTPNAPDGYWNPPDNVERAILLRAQAFDPQGQPVGQPTTRTYIIADLQGRQHTLPSLSIAIDPLALLNPDSGIFSPNGWLPDDDFNSGNFNQHGPLWERRAHIEFYEPDNRSFALTLGIRVHGGKTRRIMQKPLKLYARKQYGTSRIHFPLFHQRPYTSFKRLKLKPFSAAWNPAGSQEQLAQHLNFPSLASRPATLYINGEYWGIYFIQEAPDQHLVEQLHGIDNDSVNLIGNWHGLLENGQNNNFLQLIQWLQNANLADTLQYLHLTSLVDIDNFIDYQLFEAFIANHDWPANNMRCYQFANSPWRWIFFDADAAFGSPDLDMHAAMTFQGNSTWPSSPASTLMLRRLLDAPPFLLLMGLRLHSLASSLLSYRSTAPVLKNIQNQLSPEIEHQCLRFGTPENRKQWQKQMDNIDEFLRLRPQKFIEQMEQLLAPPHNATHTLHLFPNPAHRQVSLQTTGSSHGWTHCQIYNLAGRLVATLPIFLSPDPRTHLIPLHTLAPGTYILRLPNSTKAARLIVL